jgi:Rod binding domain-containing protein
VDRKLKEAAEGFEAILVASFLREVGGVGAHNPGLHRRGGSLFHGGFAQDIYQQFFAEEVARAIARGGGIGVAKMLYRQLGGRLPRGPNKDLLKEVSEYADVNEKGRHGVSLPRGAHR